MADVAKLVGELFEFGAVIMTEMSPCRTERNSTSRSTARSSSLSRK
jgi:hypothetical protein